MTHLSDYSFIQRAVANGWFYIWFVVYVFRYDRFSALEYKRMMRFELRSVVTFLLLIAIPLHLAYDIGCAAIKYEEGFWFNSASNEIVGTPSPLWSQPNQNTASILDYALASGMALLTSIFFLLQSFYHYISKSVTKSSFMSSFEFRLNIICSFTVLAVFPLIQFLFRNNLAFREAAPQMAFSIVLLVIALLGVRTHFRFKVLLRAALLTINETTQGVAEKLEYFKDMNIILTAVMAGSGVALGIASADGLRSTPIIAHHKFASDFLVTNLNFFEFIIWVTVVLIFYPRRSMVGSSFGQSSGGGGSLSRTAPISTRLQHVEYPKSPSTPTAATAVNDYPSSNSGHLHYTGSRSKGTPSPRQERPLSVVIPYRAPDEAHKAEYVDFQVSPRSGSNFGYNDHDTYPLTQVVSHDALPNPYRPMYDDPLQSGSGSIGASPRSPTSSRQKGPPQTPLSPSPSMASARRGAASPSPFDSHQQYKQQQQQQQRMVTPTSPVFGSGTSRQSPLQTTTTRVGQHTFVLEDVPRSSQQQRVRTSGQQPTAEEYNRGSPTTPTRARKEYRSPPQY
ncbi:hypothetical protein BGZ65_003275 [Modicella reniformis]|uniref:Uncharacterized protein n=1 Tax=Modicella reniformis TaxID=1440133 RepID=A0A9P6M9C7_9FUNG|nr:hypothetical protein BGZ65_003275 [Modicella reniformis]